MKKLLIFILIFALSIAALVSCDEPEESVNGKTARECSDNVVSLMGEMVNSDKFANLYGISYSYKDKIELLKSGDYTKVSAVYELSVTDETFFSGFESFDETSDELAAYVRSNMLPTIATRINQRDGVSTLAVASTYTATQSFVCPELKSDTVYLYVFESGCPILVSFVIGEDGAVKVTANFIISSDFKLDNAAEIEASFKNFGLKGITVK